MGDDAMLKVFRSWISFEEIMMLCAGPTARRGPKRAEIFLQHGDVDVFERTLCCCQRVIVFHDGIYVTCAEAGIRRTRVRVGRFA